MGSITAVSALNIPSLILGFFALLFCAKEVIEIFAYFKKKFRVKTGSEEDKENLENRIATLEAHDNQQNETIDQVLAAINDLKKTVVNGKIEDYRYEILILASDIANGRNCTKEQLSHALKIYDKYEMILKENGLTNGEVDASIEIIKDYYVKF